MDPSQEKGPFSHRQMELNKAFYTLKDSAYKKIDELEKSTQFDNDKQKQFRTELDKQVEVLHLMVSSYFGSCDKRKQLIEACISEQIDVSDFKEIGKALCS